MGKVLKNGGHSALTGVLLASQDVRYKGPISDNGEASGWVSYAEAENVTSPPRTTAYM